MKGVLVMRAFVYLLVGIAIVAAAAFGVRHYGIDVVALAGLPGSAKTTAGGRWRRGRRPGRRRAPIAAPLPVETAKRHHVTIE